MWIILALACGFCLATSDMLCKKALVKEDSLTVAWARLAFASPFLAVFIFSGETPSNPPLFLAWLAALVPLEILSLFLYMGALKKSPLSLTVPFLALTPGFIIITGWLILGEKVDSAGLAGVGLVTAGAYVLTATDKQSGILGPVKNFFSEPGCLMMAGVAAIYSVTASGGKKLILLSSPLYVGCVYFFAVLLALSGIVAVRPGGLKRVRGVLGSKLMWALGASQAGMIATHVLAISMAPAAHMVSVKRSSLFFGVLYGILVFKEKDARYRAPGSLIMLAGVMVLGFAAP
ncbi:protein of unknown function DUF6 transmembrane [Desulfatibacillum aliphaticivorans]|uniref:EamA domain-containing protein n=1 Tax=Desulfatibacillum aliphaticivorans TaxID=218208 RepID=B8FN31_DESAL|nr:DMT family transporter [Desulfatibacillum aliphaticivorans]ACL05901.1 protein of unknown function DUF6 transmembrane [Desulfatibacillum aliphaticivorans]